MDFFKKSLFWEDIHKLHLPVEGVQATGKKKKKAQSSGLKVEGSTKEVTRSQAPRLILQTWSLSLVLPPSLPDDHVLFVWPCAQCNLDSEMSEPEPLPPVTLFSRRGTSTQTDIILVRHSCNLQRILSYSVQVPKTILYSFQMQVFTAGEQRIDTAIVFFCGFLSPRSIQLREKISLERVVYLHWFHHRRSKSLKEHILPHGATQDEKLLSTGGPLCFLLAHLSPSLAQAGVRDGGGDQQQELFSLFFCRFSFQNLVGAVYPAALLKIEAPECSDPRFGPCSLRPSISLMLFLELANGWIDFLGSNPLSQSSSQGGRAFQSIIFTPRGNQEHQKASSCLHC